MKETTTICDLPDCFIELIHRRANPTSWIVKRSRKHFFFKTHVSMNWFMDGHEARTFAEGMKRDHSGTAGMIMTGTREKA